MEQENNIDKHLLLEQYRIYCSEKESFADRNFATNKFYLCIIIAIYVIMFFTKGITFRYNISANLIMAIIGVAVSFFWWSNTDAYNTIIKVKLRHVIEEIEKQLPLQLHKMEADNFAHYKKANRVIVFSDTQKGVAIAMGLIFILIFMFELIFPIANFLYGPIENIAYAAGV